MNEAATLDCLVVEDDNEAFRDIQDALRARIPQIRQPVDRVATVEAYLAQQQEKFYDIAIVDLWLVDPATRKQDADHEGGLKVTAGLRAWNTDALVVIYSGHVDVRQTVLAMRNGAWDAINKNENDAEELLISSICEGLDCIKFLGSWFERHIHELSSRFPGEQVAVCRGEVIDHDLKLYELTKRTLAAAAECRVEHFLVPAKELPENHG